MITRHTETMKSNNRGREEGTDPDEYLRHVESHEADRHGYAVGGPFGELLDVLANWRRRHLVRYLAGAAELNVTITLNDVAMALACEETGKPDHQVTGAERKTTRTGCYQTHLPRLVDADIVEWRPGDDVIDPGPEFDRAVRVLEASAAAFDGDDDEVDSLAARVAGAFGVMG